MTDTFVPAHEADPRIGMILQDKYKIVRKLGEGGMGAVYEGEHTLIRRRVAIKCLHAHYAHSPDIVARFHREALAATSIGHPNIIECTDMGRFPDGALFMVLEFLDGQDWSKVLEESGPQPLGRVVHILSQVCDALGAAHEKGVIHRDLKPENIFLIKRGNDSAFVKVLDFGISKIKGNEADGNASSKGLTRTGMAMGTPYFMAPEQARGSRDVDHRVDIYALGVILFKALTGQYPFDDESYPMLVLKICTQEPPPIESFRPDLPSPVVDLVKRMLAKNPDERPQTCADVKAALLPFAGRDEPPVVNPDAPATASLEVGTFGGQHLPGSSTRPLGPATPATRASTSTPLAAGDEATLPRASATQIPRTSRTGLFVALGGGTLALAVALVAVLVLGGRGASTAPSTSATSTTVPPTPERPGPTPPSADSTPTTTQTGAAREPLPPTPTVATVRVQISTEPADAELYLDGDRIPNPFDADLPQSREPRTLRVQRAGYTTVVQDLVLGSFAQRIRITLRRGRGVDDRSTAGARRPGGAHGAGDATSASSEHGAGDSPSATSQSAPSTLVRSDAPQAAAATESLRVAETTSTRAEPPSERADGIPPSAAEPQERPTGPSSSLKNPFARPR